MESSLQQEFIELLLMIQNLNPIVVQQLCDFVEGTAQTTYFPQLLILLQKASAKQVDDLIALCSQEPDRVAVAQKDLKPLADEVSLSLKDLEGTFSTLFQLFHLQGLLQGLSILQLMKLFEVMPAGPSVQKSLLLTQLQQLLGQLQPDALTNLHRQMEQAQPGTEQQTLAQLLNLPLDHFQLYQPLMLLLQLDLDELLKLQEELPKLTIIQSRQLVQLLQLQPFDVLELRNQMNPFETGFGSEFLGEGAPFSNLSDMRLDVPTPPPPNAPSNEKRLSVRIVEQPPEKSVYKRNLKPNPMVVVNGETSKISGTLMVAVVLVRCDTFEEEPKFLTGNKPEKVTSGKVVTFRKLKVTTTSHQQQETLFCLKFELRRYDNESDYEVLDSVHSNPVCVLSHSTQMKPVPTAAPVITEVIPPVGPPNGGTRVAVLGNNFVDSPAARIRFDTTDVMPMFHGPGTLICHTPQHTPGTVSVRVCNSAKKWSESSATFTYDSSMETFRDPLYESIIARQHYDSSANEAAWQGNFDAVKRLQENGTNINSIDGRGYTPIHYACAQGSVEICNFLLEKGGDVNIQDKKGATALFWASVFGFDDIAQLLVEHGAQTDLPDHQGVTPLMASIIQGNDSVALVLLENGASPNIATIFGETPLHIAASLGKQELIDLLVQYGAYSSAVDDEGDTPLHYAVREAQIASVEALVRAGAYIDALNEDAETPFHLAVILGEWNVAQALLSGGASVKTQDVAGATPLQDAVVQSGCQQLVVTMLKCGANPNTRDRWGDMPAQIIAKWGDTFVVNQQANHQSMLHVGEQQIHQDHLKYSFPIAMAVAEQLKATPLGGVPSGYPSWALPTMEQRQMLNSYSTGYAI